MSTEAAAPLASRRPSSAVSTTVDSEKGGPGTAATSESASTSVPVKGEKVGHSHTLATVVEDVFSSEAIEGEPDYRGVKWPQAFVLLLKSQIGLGVLSLPHVILTLGYVPYILVLLVLGAATTYGNYEIGRFTRVYPGCHTVGDVGFILAGGLGREVFGAGYFLYQCFIGAGGILTTSIALNAVSDNAVCNVVFAVCAAIVIGVVSSTRTFKALSLVGWIGMTCLLPAIFIVTIAAGVQSRPGGAPQTGVFDKELRAFASPSFADAMSAVVVVVFAFGGSPGFFSVIAEMARPQDYNKAMFLAQGISMSLYLTISTVLWWYCGQYVTSPALGSAGPLIKKIAYGIAIPGLLAGPIIAIHSSVKYVFVRILRGSRHLQHSTPTHWITWLGLCFSVTAFSFIIAEVIPFFDDLLGLIGAVFASFFCIIIFGFMWLHDNKAYPKPPSLKNKLLHINAYCMIIGGAFIFVAGLYGSILSIQSSFNAGTVGAPFSCSAS